MGLPCYHPAKEPGRVPGRRVKHLQAICHPEKKNKCGGLCANCYRKTREGKTVPRAFHINLYQIAALSGLTLGEAKAILRIIKKVMTEALLKGETVTIDKFGTFQPYHREAYRHGTPWGNVITAPAQTVVKFTPASALSYLVNPQDFA